jgi:NAD(P)-dependent dehydrogenase (short-subunit alcohol dehydrogenase family)
MPFTLPHISHDLSGQVALVTGASSGFGNRFARVLAACGARVAVTARRRDRLDTLVAEIAADGGEAMAFDLDVTNRDALERIVPDVAAALGQPTILINNAGIPDAQRATKMSSALIDRVFDTNLRAPFVLSCEFARPLIAAGQPGRIVNIASVAAFRYDGNGAALYSTTKAGVDRMTKALSVEWAAQHINVNCIAPGAFQTEMIDGMVERIGTDFSQMFPRKRFGDVAQMDSTLLFLVSSASDAVTGATIVIDDGQGAK